MTGIPHRRALVLGLVAAVLLAGAAWAAGRGIRSPAQVAADTAAPTPSPITVPVARRTLSTEVIVRGTVRYGSPQNVALAGSAVKQGGGIVSRPPRAGSRLREGSVVLVMSGRPVFVLRGAVPMYRDLAQGSVGEDVRQLESALGRLGFAPGPADGRYDAATAAAVAAWYRKGGWDPFSATDLQAEQVRSARAGAASARDALVQTRLALAAAGRGATPAEINQASVDAVTAADGVAAAVLELSTARTRARTSLATAARARASIASSVANAGREAAATAADLVAKQAALGVAIDAQAEAQRRLDTLPADTTAARAESLRVALRRATDAVTAAQSALDAARSALDAALAAETAAAGTGASAEASARSDVAAARADVSAKQAAFNAATDDRNDAQRRLDSPLPADTPAAELEALRTSLRQAISAVTVARSAVAAATAANRAAQAATAAAAPQAGADARAAGQDARLAAVQVQRARQGLATSRRLAALARARVAILTGRTDTTLQREIVAGAQSDLLLANREVARLAARSGYQVPADELLFFPALPLRVDTVALKRGASASGRVMTVSNSQLAADSSLSINDAKLVRVGAPVTIEEPDLGIKIAGTVTRVATKPGTDRVDPTRVYFEVTPKGAPARLVGASVKLTIAVQSTRGSVLAVPLSALSVGADGSSRLQIMRPGGTTAYLTVTPGLAANGLVEVSPRRGAELRAGDLVVVGVSVPPVAPAATVPAVTAPTTTGPVAR